MKPRPTVRLNYLGDRRCVLVKNPPPERFRYFYFLNLFVALRSVTAIYTPGSPMGMAYVWPEFVRGIR